MTRLVVFLVDVLIHNQKLIFGDLLLVHFCHSSLSVIWVLEADIAVILKIC
jgi:hypothetical protein